MSYIDPIDVPADINVNMTSASKECIIYRCWY